MIALREPRVTTVFAHLLGVLAERASLFALRMRHSMRTRRNVARTILVAFAAACTLALGQGAGQPPTPQAATSTSSTYSFQREEILNDIATAVSARLDDLRNNAKLRGFGTLISAFFLVAMLVWSGVKTMATGRGFAELIGDWVPIFVAFGIVTLFLDRGAADLIVSTMDAIGAAIGGASMATLNSALQAGADPIFRAISAVVDQPRVTSAADTGSSVLGVLSFAAAVFGAAVMSIGAKVVSAFLLVLAGVVMAAHIIMGFIAVQLVLALAPVMVPFLMFRPLAWLFDGWLKFLLGACMLKIVVAFLLNLAAGLLAVMNELATRYYSEAKNVSASETFSTDVLLLGLMLVFALLATLLLSQAPSIATGLLSGSAGSVGFRGLGAMTSGLGNRSAGKGAEMAEGVRAGVAQVGRNAFSYRAGMVDAQKGRLPSLAYRDPRAKAAYATAYRNYSKPKPPASSS